MSDDQTKPTKPTDLKAVIQEVWEALNGCVYDLEEGDPEDALTTLHEMIALLEKAGAN